MAQFTIQVPDGRKLTLEAADQGAAIAGAQDWVSKNPPQQAAQAPSPATAPAPVAAPVPGFVPGQAPTPGMLPAMRANWGKTQSGVAPPEASVPAPAPDPNAVGPNERRGELAPVIRNEQTGALRLAWPQIAMDIGNAFKLPGDVASGKTPLDPRVPYSQQDPATLDRAATLAGAVGSEMPMASRGMVPAATEEAAAALPSRAAVNAAIKDAPAASDIKSAASAAFEAATGGKPIQISDNAYIRFLGDVKQVSDKLRINAENDPQSVGLLKVLTRIADDTNNGVVVDMKDLHLVRQLAQKVGQSSNGRDAMFGNTVARKMDNFITTLKPSDVFGADPTKAANDLMTGISGWKRGIKVGIIEKAIQKADGYASGTENGLRLQFGNLMRSDDFASFSPVEQQAIREVAKGTTKQNIAKAIGKLGFSFGGTAGNNIIGGGIGAALSTAALSPLLGPAAPYVGPAASMAASAAGRAAAERMAAASAKRAAQIVATPNIPVGAPRMPQPLLQGGADLAQILARAGILSSAQNGGGGGGF